MYCVCSEAVGLKLWNVWRTHRVVHGW